MEIVFLVTIPSIRHTDFTMGYVGWTAFESGLYAITGGILGDDVSDVKRLDNGEIEAGLTSFINFMYTYTALTAGQYLKGKENEILRYRYNGTITKEYRILEETRNIQLQEK